jgi:hypothetical protein
MENNGNAIGGENQDQVREGGQEQVLVAEEGEEAEEEAEEEENDAEESDEEDTEVQVQLPNAGLGVGGDDIKCRAWSVRKPRLMDEKDDIRLYLEDFDNFADVVKLPKKIRYNTLVSYLPSKSRLKLRSLELSAKQMKNWSKVKPIIIEKLTPPADKLESQLKLDSAKQEIGESIENFVERLRLLIEKCYSKSSEKPLRERVLKDLMTRGLSDNQVRIEVLTHSDTMSLDKLVQLAIRRELAVRASERNNTVRESTLSILNVREAAGQYRQMG